MGLFHRKKPSLNGKERSKDEPQESRAQRFLRRPGNTAFKQQRLKAWQPILTPKIVIPTLLVIGLVFAPIGAVLVWGSDQVSTFTIDYTGCQTGDASNTLTQMTSDRYSYAFHGGAGNVPAPQWEYQNNTDAANVTQRTQCNIIFNVPKRMQHPVYMYYKLENYYQNHRRYVRSLDTDQMKGKARSYSDIQGGQCRPLDVIGDSIIYPCGLIANSVFNDSFTLPMRVNTGGANVTYNMTDQGIAWSGDAKAFQPTTYQASQIVPPPFWQLRYPNGYNDTNIFNPNTDEHFQVWMRTAALPRFRKLFYRNDNDDLEPGDYAITVYDNYPVEPWGKKAIVFTTVAWIGGKNSFLGWAYVATSALLVAVALGLAFRHLIKPRRLGDLSYLSWNQPDKAVAR